MFIPLIMAMMTRMMVMMSLCSLIFLKYCEISIFYVVFGIEVRILTPYRVGTIGKTLIFGLDSTISRR